jgi:hypothetical protein
MSERIDWGHVLIRAAEVVEGYDTPVTLRQVFYRLVADGTLPNTTGAYKRLSARTAEARREGRFPDLADRTRSIVRPLSFGGAVEARRWLADVYRRDRTEGQAVSVYLGVEKHGLVAQIESWFGDLGVPVVALGGYSSQSFVDEVRADVEAQGRPAVLVYAGDFDPSGEDIDRDFVERTGCFDKVVRVALTAAQVTALDLPPAMGKATDSRASAFVARHGRLVQVELDALPPDVLRELYRDALDPLWDMSLYRRVVEIEAGERESLS